MPNPTRVPDDLVVPGVLYAHGGIQPLIARSMLEQDNNQVFSIPMTVWRVWDAMATVLPGTPATDDFGLVGGTFATDSPSLQTLDGGGATTTIYARAQVVLPIEYVAGQTVTLRFSAGMLTTVADGSATLDVQAYKSDREAGIGADICATAAQSVNSLTLADKDFTITPATLSPGDVLDVRIAFYIDDTGDAGVMKGIVGAAELLCDVKG
ncbi:MAG: hypothetical protein ACYSWU_12190 [Planctomycetota bacterium]|jgi:hypothetical protein